MKLRSLLLSRSPAEILRVTDRFNVKNREAARYVVAEYLRECRSNVTAREILSRERESLREVSSSGFVLTAGVFRVSS